MTECLNLIANLSDLIFSIKVSSLFLSHFFQRIIQNLLFPLSLCRSVIMKKFTNFHVAIFNLSYTIPVIKFSHRTFISHDQDT